MVHDATKWNPSMDKNLNLKDVEEIRNVMNQSSCNEANPKNTVVKDKLDEVTKRAKTYIEIFESRKNYLKYGLENRWTVAHELARLCYRNEWTTNNPKVLSLRDNNGVTVEQILKENKCI